MSNVFILLAITARWRHKPLLCYARYNLRIYEINLHFDLVKTHQHIQKVFRKTLFKYSIILTHTLLYRWKIWSPLSLSVLSVLTVLWNKITSDLFPIRWGKKMCLMNYKQRYIKSIYIPRFIFDLTMKSRVLLLHTSYAHSTRKNFWFQNNSSKVNSCGHAHTRKSRACVLTGPNEKIKHARIKPVLG